MRISDAFVTSPERTETVIEEITQGSEPRGTFFALMITAAMIAAFGLVSNSTAVIIGAMLVSPLMTPIFGVAVGMLLGNARLFWRALTAETVGVVLAVGSAYVFGLLGIVTEATPEMLARTQPNLIDLLVAVFAGFAGAYALLDARVSPALPGVAIATAIVPPLSTAGLCLSMGAWNGAGGALLLFFANFMAILIVALLTFTAAGAAPVPEYRSLKQFTRRYGLTAAAFAVIVFVLTNSMLRIVFDRHIQHRVDAVLTDQISKYEAGVLEAFECRVDDGTLYVLAYARAQEMIGPGLVKRWEEAVSKATGHLVELMVRSTVARDTVATGSFTASQRPDFNGVFFRSELTDHERRQRLVMQVLLEQFEGEPGFRLVDVDIGKYQNRAIVVAMISTIRTLHRDEILRTQTVLQDRLEDGDLALVIRSVEASLTNAGGPILLGWTNRRGAVVEDEDEIGLAMVERLVQAEVQKLPNVFPVAVHFNLDEEVWQVLVEVVGPHPITPEQVAAVQTVVNQEEEQAVRVNIWHRGDAVTTTDGYTTYEEFTKTTADERMRSLRAVFADETVPREDK